MKLLISIHHMKSDFASLLATLMLCGLLGTASISLATGDTDGVTGFLKVFWQTAGFGWSDVFRQPRRPGLAMLPTELWSCSNLRSKRTPRIYS